MLENDHNEADKLSRVLNLVLSMADTQQHTREAKEEALRQVRELKIQNAKQVNAIKAILLEVPVAWDDEISEDVITLLVKQEDIKALFEAVGGEGI